MVVERRLFGRGILGGVARVFRLMKVRGPKNRFLLNLF